MTLLGDCLDYIRSTDYVSFAELERWLEGRGVPVHGEWAVEPTGTNIILWADMSREFLELVQALQPHTELSDASILIYAIDGRMPRLPLARRLPKGGYKEPHWHPCTLRAKRVPA